MECVRERESVCGAGLLSLPLAQTVVISKIDEFFRAPEHEYEKEEKIVHATRPLQTLRQWTE